MAEERKENDDFRGIVRVTGGGRELHRETRGLYRKSYKAMLTL